MAGTPSPSPWSLGSLERRAVAAFTQRLGLKATAIFLAIVLWFVVNAKEPQIELVTVRFTPVLDSSLVLRDPLPPLQALVAGAPNQLIKLSSATLVIRRQITADAPDTLVLDLRPQDVTLPEGVEAVVQDVQPRSLVLRFEPTWSRKVPVQSMLEVVVTAAPGPLVTLFDPDSVTVSGPRHAVIGISAVRTVKTTIPYPDSLTHLVDVDTTGLEPGVRVRPAQVKVQLSAVAASAPSPTARGRRGGSK